MEGTIYSLIPAILMLILVVCTRKIFLSLGVGIVVGALMLHQFNIVDSVGEVVTVFVNIFYSTEDGVNLGSLYLLSFLLLLGILTAIMTASGGSKAFGNWAVRRITTRRGALLVPAILGLAIFIDDYFNALAVGQVARPVTDRHKVSRAKLAYIIDSTSAPITVISPISSWGAYIIGTMGSIFAVNEIVDYQPLEAFVRMIPLNMYAFSAILLVFLVICFNLNLGALGRHEQHAIKTGELYDLKKGNVSGELKEAVAVHNEGKMMHLIIPILTLVVATVISMLWTGYLATEDQVTIFSLFTNTDVNLSLFLGGLIAVIVAFGMYSRQSSPKSSMFTITVKGMESMLTALYILILAWMIGDIIGELNTGGYLASLVDQATFNINYLPVILFMIAGLMALATGTSWGTFGIMLPIAAQIAVSVNPSLVLPAMSAVLAGSVFGDHCSPISDTTILSSTGAGANHIDHVVTQLPYALISAVAAVAGYVMYAWTELTFVALLSSLLTIVVLSSIMALIKKNQKSA
ncbi:Na+/H+ antiporter NhaC family protein [Amphibacillus sediminis]|uniref:Na+/H+ antiporter NhaC family protein n=1 Tax=Amphibacillus sediminis TaxID=360185 RepID=UPI000832BE21|nr:Na+/H+ antiporter NhaC family protein [Amphibacillus sediminis]